MKKADYIDKPAIAVHALSAFSGIEIVDIDNDRVIVRDWVHSFTQNGKESKKEIHIYKIYYGTKRPYFNYRNGCRFHLDDFVTIW
jgi:uncharacterized membrane-anchored protein